MRMSQLVPHRFGGTQKPRTVGKIRAGIRRLTNAGRKDPKAVEIYRRMVANGATFAEIASAIQSATGTIMTTPSNSQFFSVRENDFSTPEIARQLLSLYGQEVEIEGVKVPALMRFPISAVSDEVEENLDFAYKCYTATGLKYWSAPADAEAAAKLDTTPGKLVCMQFQEVPRTPEGKAVRLQNGRGVTCRSLCQPQSCAQFQGGQCQMEGKLYFYVPGIKMAAPFEMKVSSKCFGMEAEATLDQIRTATKGNLTRFERPIFFLTKKERQILMGDENGHPKRVKQHIVVLEAAVDIPHLRMGQPATALIDAADSAAPALEGGWNGAFVSHPNATAAIEGNGANEASNSTFALSTTSQSRAVATVTPAAPESPVPTGRALQQAVGSAANEAGVEKERLTAFAKKHFGDGWITDEQSLVKLAELLREIAQPRKRFLASLAASSITLDAWMQDDPEPNFWDLDVDEINKRLNA